MKSILHRFFEEYLECILLSLLFPAFGFKTIPEAFKIITTTTTVEKLTDYPRVTSWKLR